MDEFQEALAHLAEQDLLRERRTVAGPQGALLSVDGASLLSFCSNDYLGLANHPALLAAASDGLQRHGLGASASALISGHSQAHALLERELAEFTGMERALLFANGYMANLGMLMALAGPGDTIFCDRLNHASLIDGARLSRASFKVYPHNDVARLATLLAREKKHGSGRRLVITDAVFSMDGDIAPLAELLALCERHDAWLLVDDAHGFGVLGPQGSGTLRHLSLTSPASPRLVCMATLGKAAGGAGAFVAGSAGLVDWLRQRARTYMFSTAPPPMLATAASASLKLMAGEPWRRRHLAELGQLLRQSLAHLPWTLAPSITAIHPLMVGDNCTALQLAARLFERGIWVPAIRPPTVPRGTARLRISLSTSHTADQIGMLAQALTEISQEFFSDSCTTATFPA